MGQFDNIDMGHDRAMKRMMQKAREERHAIMLEMADLINVAGFTSAAKLIQEKIMDEQKEGM